MSESENQAATERFAEILFSSIAFAGGGSGGHLLPNIAIAEQILRDEPSCRLLFLISHRPIDQKIVRSLIPRSSESPARNESDVVSMTERADAIRIVALPAATGRDIRIRPWSSIPRLISSICLAIRQLRERRVRVVIGAGGFASVAPVLAAWWLRIPVVLLELNTIPGRANRLLARCAGITCTGFPRSTDGTQHWPGPVIQTGVPLRRGFSLSADQLSHVESAGHSGTLLILGGSQGSVRMNQLVMEVMSEGTVVPWSWRIVHQSGPDQLDEVAAFYKRTGRSAIVSSFFEDLPQQLQQATLVLSRAGGLTLAEIACCGKPVILLPLSTSADEHQLRNAEYLIERGAALGVDETSATAAADLSRALHQCVNQPNFCKVLGQQMRLIAAPDATSAVLRVIRQQIEQ